ncbi:MAG TPA: UDP-N-acetyl-D-glucosamine dehydrogenase, partial [Anaerolineae bacterium]|nr:UDP-N-acetyl-D-glucosamine dehydrogenase [Anaerolineae bacterium]
MNTLANKIAEKNARVAVIGLGYVGLPLAVGFAKAGYPVLGLDVDEHKLTAIRQGR